MSKRQLITALRQGRSAHAVAFHTAPPRWNDPRLKDAETARIIHDDFAVLREEYSPPKYPLVLAHGLLGFDTVTVGPSIAPLQVTHWRGIKEAFEANGVEVLMTRVPATSTPIDRAKVLCEKISEVYPGRSVHLIGEPKFTSLR